MSFCLDKIAPPPPPPPGPPLPGAFEAAQVLTPQSALLNDRCFHRTMRTHLPASWSRTAAEGRQTTLE